MTLNNFLSSGFKFNDEEYELKLHYYLFNSILLIVIVFLSILTVLRYSAHAYLQAGVDLAFVLLSVTSIYYLRRSQQYKSRITVLMLVIAFFLVTFSFLNIGANYVGTSWYIIYLLAVFFLGGKTYGLIAAFFSFFTIIISGLVLNIGYGLYEYFYLLSPLLMSVAFIVLYDKRNTEAKILLYEKNISLEREVERKTLERTQILEDANAKISQSEERLLEAQKIAHIGDWELDLASGVIVWSDEVYKIYGVDPAVFMPSLDAYFQFLDDTDIVIANAKIQTAIGSGNVEEFHHKVTRSDGETAYVDVRGKAFYNSNGVAVKIFGSVHDVTKEQLLLQRSKELADVVETSNIELFIVDYETDRYLYVNQGALNALGYSYDEMMKMTVYDINPTLTLQKVQELKHIEPTVTNLINVTEHERKDGTKYGVQSFIHGITYNGRAAYVIYDIDNTEQQKAEEELIRQQELLTHQAYHDSLTNLPNRALLNDRLMHSIAKANRSEQLVGVLFIDLDQFKQINDSLGHEIGDEVLTQIALRFKKVLRNEDTLARLGGDEFIVVIDELVSPMAASTLSQKLIQVIQKPVLIKGQELFVTCSIGISIYPKDGNNATLLLRNADAAMYRAKEEGRNTFNFYTKDMTDNAYERVVMETSLRHALEKEEFIVYYQPQYNAFTNELLGMEALIRWEHPTMGIVSPGSFIPLAEENGMIVNIDRYVLTHVMHQLVTWHSEGLDPGKVSVNLSIKQLIRDDFFDFVTAALESTQCQSKWLKFEVTESQIMKNPQKAIDVLKRISALGIDLAVDDFGTGYSSLSYLKRLPINQLKIDQSFIRDIPHDDEDVAITKAIIALAQSMKLHVIAEGVETEQQREFLLANECMNMQGYLYSKPVSSAEVYKLLKKI